MLNEVLRVLRPGGSVGFYEHVASEETDLVRRLSVYYSA